jgi:hypothetical protein
LEADPGASLDLELLRFLRLKFIEGTDAFILESVFSNIVYDTLSLPFSRVNEVRVMKYLSEELSKKLENMNEVSSDEKDREIIDNSTTSPEFEGISVALARLRIQVRDSHLNSRFNLISCYLKGTSCADQHAGENR